jgi:hypothetical protein
VGRAEFRRLSVSLTVRPFIVHRLAFGVWRSEFGVAQFAARRAMGFGLAEANQL